MTLGGAGDLAGGAAGSVPSRDVVTAVEAGVEVNAAQAGQIMTADLAR